MAVPPPGRSAGFMKYGQLKKSWYMFFFQHAISDVVVRMDDLAFIDGLWRSGPRATTAPRTSRT